MLHKGAFSREIELNLFNKQVKTLSSAHLILLSCFSYPYIFEVKIGKQDAPEKLSEAMAEREVAPRSRKSLDELVIAGLPQL